jgi:hypothetical protein
MAGHGLSRDGELRRVDVTFQNEGTHGTLLNHRGGERRRSWHPIDQPFGILAATVQSLHL